MRPTRARDWDQAKDLYLSGMSNLKVGDNQAALAKFQRVVAEHPKSPFAPRAYYAIGLIYEQQYNQLDSAYSYYGRLVDRFPRSEQALAVAPLLQAVNVQRMRRPNNEVPPIDSSGVNMDWMKENPPVDPDDEPDVLIPLNGDTSKLKPRVNPVGTSPGGGQIQPGAGQSKNPAPPAGQPSGAPAGSKPADIKPQGTKPGGVKPSGTKPTGTKPSGTKPSGTKPTGTKPSGAPAVPPKAGTPPNGSGTKKTSP